MFQSRIKEPEVRGDIAVERLSGIDAAIDRVIGRHAGAHRFLRAAWYGRCNHNDAVTLIASRVDGTPLAAVPTVGFGPALIGARSVPGSYWPFRSLPISPDADTSELAAFFAHPLALDALGPVWRLGPVYADDRVTVAVKRAAAAAGWTVLLRRLGQTFVFDTRSGWPGRSTRRRLANYARQLAQHGDVTIDSVRGAGWNAAVLDDLGAVERASWIGRTTDGTGAKFMTEARRSDWGRVLADPVLAEALTATILRIDGKPIAFSFDLLADTTQYSIASSFHERFGAFRPGKLVTAHQLEIARELGIERIDFGAGDSGYKREMGAERGSEIVDLLIVRSRATATLLKLRWGRESTIARDAYLAAATLRNAGRETMRRGRFEALLAMAAVVAAAVSFIE